MRLLVAADDGVFAEAVAEALRGAVQATVDVTGPFEAVEQLDTATYKLVVVQSALPPERLRGLVRGLTAMHPETPLLLVVPPDTPPETAADYVLAGADGLTVRPWTPSELAGPVRAALDTQARQGDTADRFRHHVHAARLALDARRLDAARAHARRAVSFDAAQPEPFNVLGIVAQLSLDLAEAQRLYRTALALDPLYAPAQANLRRLAAFPRKLSVFDAGG